MTTFEAMQSIEITTLHRWVKAVFRMVQSKLYINARFWMRQVQSRGMLHIAPKPCPCQSIVAIPAACRRIMHGPFQLVFKEVLLRDSMAKPIYILGNAPISLPHHVLSLPIERAPLRLDVCLRKMTTVGMHPVPDKLMLVEVKAILTPLQGRNRCVGRLSLTRYRVWKFEPSPLNPM